MAYGIPIEDATRTSWIGIEPGLVIVRMLLLQALAVADNIDDTLSHLVACSISLAIDQLDHPSDDGRF